MLTHNVKLSPFSWKITYTSNTSQIYFLGLFFILTLIKNQFYIMTIVIIEWQNSRNTGHK